MPLPPKQTLMASLRNSTDPPPGEAEPEHEHPAYPTARALRIVANWFADPSTSTCSPADIRAILRAAADDLDPPEADY